MGSFDLRVKLSSVYDARLRLHTVFFNGERQAGKL